MGYATITGLALFALTCLSIYFDWADRAFAWVSSGEDKIGKIVMVTVAMLLAAGIIWQTFIA